MHRPIGVTLLAIGAGLAGVFQVWRMLVFLGVAKWTFLGKEVSFQDPQWGSVFWAAILALIWFWVAVGMWNVRGYAWSFGIFVAMFTVIFGFFALIGGGSTTEAETIGWFLALIILFYLNYPGVRDQFVQHEMSLLTPEQRAAMENLAKANAAAAQAMAAPAPAPAAAAPAAQAPAPAAPAPTTPPAAPPSDPTNPAS